MSGTPLLLVAESAQAKMFAAAIAALPNETGGILLGVSRDGQPWVTEAVEIVTKERGRHHYKIPAGVTQPTVLAAREADYRLGYLGDWHSHPADVGPSATDLATLAMFSVKHPKTPNPNLVVVRAATSGLRLDVRRIMGISPRQCEVRLTGNLGSE